MAANAVERPAGLRANWLRLLAANPERLEFATRLALICSLTTLGTEIYQTPFLALAAYLPFFTTHETLDHAGAKTLVIWRRNGWAARLRPMEHELSLCHM